MSEEHVVVDECAKQKTNMEESTLEMTESQNSQFVLNTKFQRKPVKLSEDGCNMLVLFLFGDETGGTVLNSLKTIYLIRSDTGQGWIFCKITVVRIFIHKILAKYWPKIILMNIFCQFSSLTPSIYWQKQYYTKKLKQAYFESRMSNLHQTKTILTRVLSLTCWIYSWIYSDDPKVRFYFPKTSFLTSLVFSLQSCAKLTRS